MPHSRKSTLLAVSIALFGLALAAISAADDRAAPRLGPYPELGKCGVFPHSTAAPGAPSAADETAWNQDISKAPVDPNSTAYIAYIDAHGGDMLHPDFGSPRAYGFPYAVVGKHAKRSKVHFTAYGDESDHGRYRIPAQAPVEGGKHSDGDRHVVVYDKARCKLYELGRAFSPQSRKHALERRRRRDLEPALRRAAPAGFTSADAAGLPIFPGLVRYDEARGAVNHAIRVTVDSTQDAWIPPASHCAGDSDSRCAADGPAAAAEGRL